MNNGWCESQDPMMGGEQQPMDDPMMGNDMGMDDMPPMDGPNDG